MVKGFCNYIKINSSDGRIISYTLNHINILKGLGYEVRLVNDKNLWGELCHWTITKDSENYQKVMKAGLFSSVVVEEYDKIEYLDSSIKIIIRIPGEMYIYAIFFSDIINSRQDLENYLNYSFGKAENKLKELKCRTITTTAKIMNDDELSTHNTRYKYKLKDL